MKISNQDWETVLYINGVAHRTTPLGGRFFADLPEMPRTPCSQHGLLPYSVEHLKAGGAVITSGNRYSLVPPKVDGNAALTGAEGVRVEGTVMQQGGLNDGLRTRLLEPNVRQCLRPKRTSFVVATTAVY